MIDWNSSFVDRDDAELAQRLDQRRELVAGLRVVDFSAGANLKMSAAVDALESWRREQKPPWRASAVLACACAAALRRDPLFGALFDGRDRLELPAEPALGIGIDTGDRARTLVLPQAAAMPPAELAAAVDAGMAGVDRRPPPPFTATGGQRLGTWRRRKRWALMSAQELRQRFDYMVPPLQRRRLKRWVEHQGHFQLHNVGARGIQEFKGFLRRPAVAALFALAIEPQVVSDGAGGFVRQLRWPLLLVYSQELIPIDRACSFLSCVVEALERPAELLGGGR